MSFKECVCTLNWLFFITGLLHWLHWNFIHKHNVYFLSLITTISHMTTVNSGNLLELLTHVNTNFMVILNFNIFLHYLKFSEILMLIWCILLVFCVQNIFILIKKVSVWVKQFELYPFIMCSCAKYLSFNHYLIENFGSQMWKRSEKNTFQT